MTNALHRLRVWTFVIFTFEMLIMAGLALFWFFNWYSFQEYVKAGYIIFISVGFLLVDAFYSWFSLLKISKIRQKNDIEAATLVGNDIQEAYDFGQIGLVVVDESNVVMWANSLFKQRQIDLIDTQLFDIMPDLKDLINAPVNKVVKLDKYIDDPTVGWAADDKEDIISNYLAEGQGYPIAGTYTLQGGPHVNRSRTPRA